MTARWVQLYRMPCSVSSVEFKPHIIPVNIRLPGPSWCSPASPRCWRAWCLWWGWSAPASPAAPSSSPRWLWAALFVSSAPACSACWPCPGPPMTSSWTSMTLSSPVEPSTSWAWLCTWATPRPAWAWLADWCCAGAAASAGRVNPSLCGGVSRLHRRRPSTTSIRPLRSTGRQRPWGTTAPHRCTLPPAAATGSITTCKHGRNTDINPPTNQWGAPGGAEKNWTVHETSRDPYSLTCCCVCSVTPAGGSILQQIPLEVFQIFCSV